jgi:hypothetical protein
VIYEWQNYRRCDINRKYKKPGVIRTEKSQVKRKEWEKQSKCDIQKPQPPIYVYVT